MNLLSNDALVTAYCKAIQFQLDHAFIELLLKEIKKRDIRISVPEKVFG